MPTDDFGLVGQTVDQLRFEELVDGGGFGLVYRARHLGLDESVAVKCLHLGPNVDPVLSESFFQRFRDETRIVYRLSQGNLDIVRSISSGTLKAPKTGEPVPYMVLEWLEGHTLGNELRKKLATGRPFTLEEAMDLLDPAFGALGHAHAQGIVHRDVKPGNLFLATGRSGPPRLKVLDFGLAKILEPTLGVVASVETMKGVALCSPSYGAPEQFVKRFGPVGPWTDVYALALVLLELLSGKKARHADSLVEGLARALSADSASPTPTSMGLTLPRVVESVLARAVARETNVRPADAGIFRQELLDAIRAARVGMQATRERGEDDSGITSIQTIALPARSPIGPMDPVRSPIGPMDPVRSPIGPMDAARSQGEPAEAVRSPVAPAPRAMFNQTTVFQLPGGPQPQPQPQPQQAGGQHLPSQPGMPGPRTASQPGMPAQQNPSQTRLVVQHGLPQQAPAPQGHPSQPPGPPWNVPPPGMQQRAPSYPVFPSQAGPQPGQQPGSGGMMGPQPIPPSGSPGSGGSHPGPRGSFPGSAPAVMPASREQGGFLMASRTMMPFPPSEPSVQNDPQPTDGRAGRVVIVVLLVFLLAAGIVAIYIYLDQTASAPARPTSSLTPGP